MSVKDYLTRPELERMLKITPQGLQIYIKTGAPKYEPGRGYPARAWCEWITGRPRSKRGFRTWDLCEALLAEMNRKVRRAPTAIAKKTKDAGPEGKTSPAGIEGALRRLRDAEVELHGRWAEAVEQKKPGTGNLFKDWQDSLDLLRRAEADLLKVLEAKKELVSLAEVSKWISRQIQTAVGRLLSLPPNIAPALEGMPWHAIQKKLDEEMRKAIAGLSAEFTA